MRMDLLHVISKTLEALNAFSNDAKRIKSNICSLKEQSKALSCLASQTDQHSLKGHSVANATLVTDCSMFLHALCASHLCKKKNDPSERFVADTPDAATTQRLASTMFAFRFCHSLPEIVKAAASLPRTELKSVADLLEQDLVYQIAHATELEEYATMLQQALRAASDFAETHFATHKELVPVK